MSQFEYEDNSYTQPLHPDALLDMVLVASKGVMAWLRSVYDATPDIDGYGHYVDLGSILGDRVQISREQMTELGDRVERTLAVYLPNARYKVRATIDSDVALYGNLYVTLHTVSGDTE
jgi:hypothetical protein